MLLAHRYNGGSSSSGFGEIVGDDSIVTLNCVNTELVSSEIESEIIGQSVEGPMHAALMKQVKEHILVATGAKQLHLI